MPLQQAVPQTARDGAEDSASPAGGAPALQSETRVCQCRSVGMLQTTPPKTARDGSESLPLPFFNDGSFAAFLYCG